MKKLWVSIAVLRLRSSSSPSLSHAYVSLDPYEK